MIWLDTSESSFIGVVYRGLAIRTRSSSAHGVRGSPADEAGPYQPVLPGPSLTARSSSFALEFGSGATWLEVRKHKIRKQAGEARIE